MEKYCKVVCDENRRVIEFIRPVKPEDVVRLSGRPNLRYIGKENGIHLIAYAPASPIQFISAIQNTRLLKCDDWHYDFGILKVNLETTTTIQFEEMLNFYCMWNNELTSSAKDFKNVCSNLRDDLKLNEELKAEAFDEYGKLI